jgi:hypothetical protein
MNALAAFSIASIALLSQVTPVAASVNADVARCRAAMAAHPEFAAVAYDAKFERYREGRIRTVRFALKPHVGADTRLVFCRIERGRVAALEVRAR